MTFHALTDDQRLLQEAAGDFIRSQLPVPAVRELVESGGTVDAAYLEAASSLGWFGTLVPEELGGASVSELGLVDLSIVAELRGQHLQPGPFAGTNIVAAAIARAGTDSQQAELLPELAAGRRHAAWVTAELRAEAGSVGVPATAADGGVVLDGVAARVHEAGLADVLLVTVSVDGEPRQFVVPKATPGIEATPLETLDLTSSIEELQFADVVLPAAAELGGDDVAADIAHQLAVASVLVTSESAGAMAQLLALTIDYAKHREAFGSLIGSFQAVKHQVADTSLLVHSSKSAAGAAADAVALGHADANEVASIAKSFVSDHSHQVGQTCFQLHGGIGYAWEHDLHLYLRRLTGNAVLYGSAAFHRSRILQIHASRRVKVAV